MNRASRSRSGLSVYLLISALTRDHRDCYNVDMYRTHRFNFLLIAAMAFTVPFWCCCLTFGSTHEASATQTIELAQSCGGCESTSTTDEEPTPSECNCPDMELIEDASTPAVMLTAAPVLPDLLPLPVLLVEAFTTADPIRPDFTDQRPGKLGNRADSLRAHQCLLLI